LGVDVIYPAIIKDAWEANPSDTGFYGEFRDWPNGIVGVFQGETLAETVQQAREILAGAIEMLKEEGKPLPEPSKPEHGDVMIAV